MPSWLSKFKSNKEFLDDDKTPLWLNPAGWRRIKRFYHGLFYGSQSVEPEFVENVMLASLFSGFAFGSMIASRSIMQDMKERFNEYQFAGKTDHARKIVGMTLLASSRNGMRYSFHTCLITSFFAIVASTFAVYRNDIRTSDMIISGALGGAFYGLYKGPKAMIRTSLLAGGLIGLPIGIFCRSYLWLLDISYSDFALRWRDMQEFSTKERVKKEVERMEKIRYYNTYDSDKSETRILDHDIIVANYSDKGIVDESFSKCDEPPDYVKKIPEEYQL
ncbi:complex I assembly factor TIMMDC1, mitochondrial-like [Brevipalpus obovatus]|uniref:complex I assembly factor TIMMDC1, mitochondrial-like n=1 Tax=Brevipalpus obovatus TaxID=246614 RepID=UPI003D9E50E0